MGSVISKKKEPEPEKPKITEQDKEILVSRGHGFHVRCSCGENHATNGHERCRRQQSNEMSSWTRSHVC